MTCVGWKIGAVLLAVALSGCAERTNVQLVEAAREYLARNEVDSATLELRTLLQRKPDAGEARFLLGKIHFEAGDMTAAEDQLGLALQYGYPEEEVVPLLVEALASLNRSKAILTKFGDLEFSDRAASADLKVLVAMAHIREGDRERAEKDLARALALVPDHPGAQVMQARMKATRGDEAGAARDVDALLARVPNQADALAFKGDLLMMSGPPQVDAALAAHRRALALKPRMPQSHSAVLSMLIARGQADAALEHWNALKTALPQHPQTHFFEGVLALLKGDADRARRIAHRMLQSSPTDLRLLLLAAQGEMQMGQFEQAEALLTKALGYAPRAPAPRHLLAEIQLRTGRPADALTTLAALIGPNANDPVALTLAGRAHLIAGDAVAAKARLTRALALAPNDKRVRTSAALARLGAGQADTAFAELEAIAKADDSTTADLALISARLERRQFEEAAKAVDALAAKQPTQALPHQLRGRIALAKGDAAAARTHFEAALAKEASYFPALSGLVALDMREGRADSARARLEAARQRSPGSMQVRLALATLAAQRGAPAAEVTNLLEQAVQLRPSDPAPHLALVDHHLSSGRGDQALLAAEKAMAAVPDDQAVLDRLGLAQLAGRGMEQAISTYNKMIVQWPRSSLGYQRLAEIYLRTGNTPLAAERVEMALKEAPRSVQAQQVAATVALRQRKPAQALAIARSVQEQRPGEAVGYELEGEIALAQHQFDRAEAAYRKAMDRGAAAAVAKRLHLALVGAKRTADARRWADDWLKARPKDTTFVVHLADVALSQGDLPEAEARYRQAMERLPGNALAMNNVAYLMIKQGKPGGLALAEQAAKLDPENPTVLDTVAAGYAAENKLAKAIEWQVKAVELAPEGAMLRLSLARLYIRASEREKALLELDRLAKLGRSFSAYSEVAQLRKRLGP